MSARGLDDLLAAAGLDPADGLQVASAARLPSLPFDPGVPLLILPATVTEADAPSTEADAPIADALAADAPVLPGRHARSGLHAVLLALYPAAHPVRPLPSGPVRRLETLSDAELAAGTWLVPALEPLDNLASPHGMAAISARLRAPDGCPWDRRQTHASLRPFVLEEAYELVDAIERGSPADLAEELGDLFLQIILHAQLAAEASAFDLTDVYRTLGAKIVRRHPHVFGDVEVRDAAEVIRNWEAIKAGERAEAAGPAASPFDGVARALPALAASREIQERAASLGWDWESVDGVWEKMREELDELHAAGRLPDHERRDASLHELGDVLFALVNLARWLKVDPEEALRAANRRWIERYRRVEALAAERGVVLADLSLEEKDRLWDEVKASP
ncbi:MAG TPA: nucleoside triphosphate pyrophosphohydrolase [candidate division Zixibacteria bacterium]|nr:nucleoside triphosphate pyrophosphohydrolase [candidate division Zixibacteria bacterium]